MKYNQYLNSQKDQNASKYASKGVVVVEGNKDDLNPSVGSVITRTFGPQPLCAFSQSTNDHDSFKNRSHRLAQRAPANKLHENRTMRDRWCLLPNTRLDLWYGILHRILISHHYEHQCLHIYLVFLLILGDLPMNRVKMTAKHEYEYLANYKVMQNVFKAKKIDKVSLTC